MSEAGAGHIGRLVIADGAPARLSPEVEADRAQAVRDLLEENLFEVSGLPAGRHTLHLSVQDGRLVFDVRDDADAPLAAHVLALGPFRRLMKDYQMLVDSHITALHEGREARIQAIDMGRRGLHDEGAQLLSARLTGKVRLDHATARRLFTLICVLHARPS